MDLQAAAWETIQKHVMLDPRDRVLVAVSGGPDSVALLYLLSGLRERLDLHLEAAHLQHGIRGDEAREDALFVAALADKLGIPFHLKEVDLPAVRSRKGRGNLEGMGREERYRFFAELASERDFQKIALGHTRDDQTETVLMRLIRGSGRRGMAGIPPVRPLAFSESVKRPLLIRPLIESPRQTILGYLSEGGHAYRVDASNSDPALLRNWVRLTLLPQLRQKAGGGLDERLASMAAIWRDEERVLDRVIEERLTDVLNEENLLRAPLLQEEKAIQRRLLRAWLERGSENLSGIGVAHVESALRFIAQGPPQGRQCLPGGWELLREYGSVSLKRRRAREMEPRRYAYTLPLTGDLFIPEAGLRFRCSQISSSFRGSWPAAFEARFDRARLPGLLSIRNFRPGDRFQPFGMRGHKKIKDLFIERKVPLLLRKNLPLLVADGEILWIPGCARSDVARVTPDTPEILQIVVESCADRTDPGMPCQGSESRPREY